MVGGQFKQGNAEVGSGLMMATALWSVWVKCAVLFVPCLCGFVLLASNLLVWQNFGWFVLRCFSERGTEVADRFVVR